MSTEPVDPNADIIDVEAFARKGERPPKGKRYRIRVDKTILVVPGPTITGRRSWSWRAGCRSIASGWTRSFGAAKPARSNSTLSWI